MQEFRDPNEEWNNYLEHYNEQMELILSFETTSDRTDFTWLHAKGVLDATEDFNVDEELYNELEEKVNTYEDNFIEEEYLSGSITVNDLTDGSDYNPPPV